MGKPEVKFGINGPDYLAQTAQRIFFQDKALFVPDPPTYFSFDSAWQKNQIRLFDQNEYTPLPVGDSIITGTYRRIYGDGLLWCDVNLYYRDNTLIPLGTHAYPDRSVFHTYTRIPHH